MWVVSQKSKMIQKSLQSISVLVLPRHEQFYPEGLSVFAGLD